MSKPAVKQSRNVSSAAVLPQPVIGGGVTWRIKLIIGLLLALTISVVFYTNKFLTQRFTEREATICWITTERL
jgi:hypothetical protein